MFQIVLPRKRAGQKIAIFKKSKILTSRAVPRNNRCTMITKLNHVSIFVLDQQSAHDFYINKLGFKVHTDAEMGPGMRWLTVTAPESPDLEISLMAISAGM